MAFNLSLFSGLRSDSTVPAGSLLKASSVGANTVKGPLPFRVSARPAAWSAAAKVLKVPAATAVSTIVLLSGAGSCRHGADEDAENQCKTSCFQFRFSFYFFGCLCFLLHSCVLLY